MTRSKIEGLAVNLPRSSILLWMMSIALFGLAMAVFRTFVYGSEVAQFRIGELAPLSLIGILSLAISMLTSGRCRRFFAVMAITGVVLGLSFWAAPVEFRRMVLSRIISPLDDWLGPREPGTADSRLAWSLYFVFENPENSKLRPTRNPFVSWESQIAVGLLELGFAVIAGFLAISIPWHRLDRSNPLGNS